MIAESLEKSLFKDEKIIKYAFAENIYHKSSSFRV